MGMPHTKRRWTAAEVRTLIERSPTVTPRYELVDGELLMTPSPSMPHQSAVRLLLVALTAYLDRERVGEPFSSPSDVELEPEDLRQPDVYVLPITEWRRVVRDGHPARTLLLAVEVVSPSSGRIDRVWKRSGYQRHVPEYWIVDIDARLVERWRPGEDRPEILTERLVWQPAAAATAMELDLSPFFARIWGE